MTKQKEMEKKDMQTGTVIGRKTERKNIKRETLHNSKSDGPNK